MHVCWRWRSSLNLLRSNVVIAVLAARFLEESIPGREEGLWANQSTTKPCLRTWRQDRQVAGRVLTGVRRIADKALRNLTCDFVYTFGLAMLCHAPDVVWAGSMGRKIRLFWVRTIFAAHSFRQQR